MTLAMRSDGVSQAAQRSATELSALLAAFHASTGCHASLWTRASDVAPLERRSASRADLAAPAGRLPAEGEAPRPARTADGEVHVLALAGAARTWLVVGPCDADPGALAAHAAFLGAALGTQLRTAAEADQAARELGERYEEINLLYTISEILGRAVTLEETAETILTELSETVGAHRGALFVHDRVTDTLQAVAALGTVADELAPIAVDDPASLAARVFRALHPVLTERDEPCAPGEAAYRSGATLTVPIVWSAPGGGEPLGVVSLSGRRVGTFTAGDLKLAAAIASQIGAAIQNARLVRASLQQQRLAQEMALAHDLQMKLLPAVDGAAPFAEVAARVVPAESVGGDFYNLFRLEGGRTGVMIGDVSSHGYRAALIMALAMSATAIHARASSDPAETLGMVLRSLQSELDSTEMFISTFYAVVDPPAGLLHYANAGHPHAFVVGRDGTVERLPATTPPLGLVEVPPRAVSRSWRAGEDLLVLFTDGIADAVTRDGTRVGEEPILDVVTASRHEAPETVLRRVFDALESRIGDAPPHDDLTMVVLRS